MGADRPVGALAFIARVGMWSICKQSSVDRDPAAAPASRFSAVVKARMRLSRLNARGQQPYWPTPPRCLHLRRPARRHLRLGDPSSISVLLEDEVGWRRGPDRLAGDRMGSRLGWRAGAAKQLIEEFDCALQPVV